MQFEFDILADVNTSAPVLQNFHVSDVKVNDLGIKLLTGFFKHITNIIHKAGDSVSNGAKHVEN